MPDQQQIAMNVEKTTMIRVSPRLSHPPPPPLPLVRDALAPTVIVRADLSKESKIVYLQLLEIMMTLHSMSLLSLIHIYTGTVTVKLS